MADLIIDSITKQDEHHAKLRVHEQAGGLAALLDVRVEGSVISVIVLNSRVEAQVRVSVGDTQLTTYVGRES